MKRYKVPQIPKPFIESVKRKPRQVFYLTQEVANRKRYVYKKKLDNTTA
jgi:hypothetical protein